MNLLPNTNQIGGSTLGNTSKSPQSDAANENQVSSDGSQPNPQDDMNSQKITTNSNNIGSPSDLNKPNERQKDAHVNHQQVLSCDATEMQQLRIILKQRGLPMKNSVLEVIVVPDSTFGLDGLAEQSRIFKMDEADLRNSFKQFGTISDIAVQEGSGNAYITFLDVIDATMAKMYMNNCRLEKSQATLSVQFCKNPIAAPEEKKTELVQIPNPQPMTPQQSQQAFANFQQQQLQMQYYQTQQLMQQQQQQMQAAQMAMYQNQQMPLGGFQLPPAQNQQQQPDMIKAKPFVPSTAAPSFQPTAIQQPQSDFSAQHFQQQQPKPPAFQGLATQSSSFKPSVHAQSFKPQNSRPPDYDPNQSEEDQGVKYTCRYEIQIENENQFQVARRLIGSKGANMKRIIQDCARGFDPGVNAWEIVKLRLRGNGSGFKEGPNKEESRDPLNFCISSKYKEKYAYACNEMEILLQQVYVEYKEFYKYKNRKPADWDQEKSVKKQQTETRPKQIPDNEESNEMQPIQEEEEDTQSQNQNGMAQIQAALQQLNNQNQNNQYDDQFGESMETMNSFQPNQYHIPAAQYSQQFQGQQQNTSSFYPGQQQQQQFQNYQPQPFFPGAQSQNFNNPFQNFNYQHNPESDQQHNQNQNQ